MDWDVRERDFKIAVDIESLRRVRFRCAIEIGTIKGFDLFRIKCFEALQSSPGCHNKRHIEGRPGIGDQFCAAQIIHYGFNLLLQVRATSFIEKVAVVPEDNIPMFQIMDEIASRKLIIVTIIEACPGFLGLMRTRGRRIGVVFTRVAIHWDMLTALCHYLNGLACRRADSLPDDDAEDRNYNYTNPTPHKIGFDLLPAMAFMYFLTIGF